MMRFGSVEQLELSIAHSLGGIRSVPPRGSGWVVDSELYTADFQHSRHEMRAEPTRYREVVLTSCQSEESDWRCLNIMLAAKLHEYQARAV